MQTYFRWICINKTHISNIGVGKEKLVWYMLKQIGVNQPHPWAVRAILLCFSQYHLDKTMLLFYLKCFLLNKGPPLPNLKNTPQNMLINCIVSLKERGCQMQ